MDLDVLDDGPYRLSSHLHRYNGYIAKSNSEDIHDDSMCDHIYSKSPFWRPEYIFTKPQRTLFVHPSDDDQTRPEDDIVDVDSVPNQLATVYDKVKATSVMEECDRHVNFHHPDEGNPDWEDHIPRINWSNMQTRLFNRIARVLHSDQLARLSHSGSANEPVLRRVTVDKTARRLRQTLASVAWNVKYTQWLHNTLMDNLPAAYLVSYLDALQTLKSKVPILVDRMLAAPNTRTLATPNHELLNIVHKRPWDPLSGGITKYKPRKLPKDPILVMVPSGPGASNASNSRSHHWMANLSALATVVCVYSPPGRLVGKVSVANCLDHMLASTRAKVAELHQDYGDKPIILVGIGSGAALALQVALVEKVTAVVCLGFPLYTAEDNRGAPDDALLNIQVPVLFVMGQNASTCSVEDLEDLRESLSVVTSLVVVGGADDQLRLTKAKKKLEGVTQSIVDKCITDEVADFLGTLLSPGYIPPTRPMVMHSIEPPPKRTVIKTVERKRKCDIVIPTSPDSMATVPTKKGRKPKISMMQKIVHNKWASQLPTTSNEATVRSNVSSTPQGTVIMSGGSKQVVLDKKGLHQLNIRHSLPTSTPTAAEGTITVVAASSPTLNSNPPVKSRLPSGQLTSLSTILQPGTRAVLSTGTRTGSTDDGLVTVKGINHTPIVDELNILDMPVILGDQSPDFSSSTTTLPSPTAIHSPATSPTPVRLVLSNNKSPRPTIKCAKIFISKASSVKDPSNIRDHKTVFIGDINSSSTHTKPKIRHIPATKHSQFY